MANTACDFIQQSLDWCEGEPSLAGMQPVVFYTAKSNILGWPSYSEASEDPTRPPLAVRSGKFVMKAGKSFYKVDINPDKSQFTFETAGEYPNIITNNKLTLFHNSMGLQAANASTYMNNHDCVFVFRDLAGRWRICGSPKWVGKNTVSGDGGQGPGGACGTTISVEQYDFTAAPFFQGILPTVDGDINCIASADYVND